MTLGERCDEIVRLIDETLEACSLFLPAGEAQVPAGAAPVVEPPMVTRVRTLAQLQRERLARSA